MALLYTTPDGVEASLLAAYHESLLMAAALGKLLPAALADSLPEQNGQFHIEVGPDGSVVSIYMALKKQETST